MIVLFDGTPSKPWGRYLEAQADPVRPAPSSPAHSNALSDRSVRVLNLLKTRPSTKSEIAATLGLTLDQARGALRALELRQLIAFRETQHVRHFGRPTSKITYRAVGWGERR